MNEGICPARRSWMSQTIVSLSHPLRVRQARCLTLRERFWSCLTLPCLTLRGRIRRFCLTFRGRFWLSHPSWEILILSHPSLSHPSWKGRGNYAHGPRTNFATLYSTQTLLYSSSRLLMGMVRVCPLRSCATRGFAWIGIHVRPVLQKKSKRK